MCNIYDFLVFGGFYLIGAIVIASVFCALKRKSNQLFIVLVVAAIFRMLETYGYYFYSLQVSADANAYYNYAINVGFNLSSFLKGSTEFIQNLSALFIIPFTGFDNSKLMLYIPYSLLAYSGSILFFEALQNIKPYKKTELYAVCFFLPNLVFWTSNLGKDSIIYLGLMIFLNGILLKRKIVFKVVYILLGCTIVYMVRPHIVLFLMVGFGAGYMLEKNKFSFQSIAIIIIMMTGFLLTYQMVFKFVGITVAEETEQGGKVSTQNVYDQSISRINSQQENLSKGGAATKVSSMRYIFAPVYVVNFICAPFVWQVRKPIHLLGAVESIIYQVMLIYIFRQLKFLIKDKTLPFKNSWIIYVILSSIIMGATFANFGVSTRQRCMVIPFVVMIFILTRSLQLKRQQSKKKGKAYSFLVKGGMLA